jgi:ATP-dependent Clp protease ATP-binding subunit ClpA
MFERFTDAARRAVTQAQSEARGLRHGWLGTEHLLLGILADADSLSARTLWIHGIDHDLVVAAIIRQIPAPAADLDAEALDTIGIDLSSVREKVEAAFGPGALDRVPGSRSCGTGARFGHLPFTRRAKKCLELSLREALRLRHQHIADGHILLGILREGEGMAAQILAEAGVDIDALRRDVSAALSLPEAG